MAGVFEALGDPVRRRILEHLADGEAAAGVLSDLARAEFAISQPATSQHLRVLREASLVNVRAEGTRRLYAVDPDGLDAVQDWLARFQGAFSQPLDALATELARGRRERRRAATADRAEGRPAAAGRAEGRPAAGGEGRSA
ncbi:transcriptional regulator, ArsR family [Beutenbergia cavernae DSM 12333]|uniref:Transcriptional regulator, ArsR family n=1 Tax=Beutenbergia cavernae (strain ATCC BAA-8 / DSM 12333 / CCUG 43141 / JCM 11478 / NBRC 16432 / NCIMB 13614 / HKI 0122) TaxID=471853 RepID=C5C3M6_BEUC1|nr:metalloregulator ArsR/SmtB family transcription factor [Beutenbergia cavernae]ACQ81935.1 transcriptional regulator, ArsR family [Beutenbergia cavernae DSM 12333]